MAEPRRDPAPAPRIDGGRFLIVEARFYESISAGLLAGAKRALDTAGAAYDVVTVAGALEIPAGMAIALDAAASCWAGPMTARWRSVALSAARPSISRLSPASPPARSMDMSVQRKLALGNGILTTDTIAQAAERADPQQGDKGGDAARAAIGLALLKRRLAR